MSLASLQEEVDRYHFKIEQIIDGVEVFDPKKWSELINNLYKTVSANIMMIPGGEEPRKEVLELCKNLVKHGVAFPRYRSSSEEKFNSEKDILKTILLDLTKIISKGKYTEALKNSALSIQTNLSNLVNIARINSRDNEMGGSK